ncbi:MAG: phosphatase PAP2 family protein [Gemmatimonadetes bacterium]|nr:phosphatase PAP2 family protein [Gemmatimonadota bacterium]
MTLGIGTLFCVGLMGVATVLARALHDQEGMQNRDRALLLRIEQLPLPFDAAIWWEAFGASSMLIPLTLVAIVLCVRADRPILAAEFFAAFALAKPIFLVGWKMWDRARPDLLAGGVAAPSLHSFPSGHAVQTVAVYGLLTYLWLRHSSSVVERIVGTAAWLALSGIVGIARLRMGVHWPSDVIVGWAIGAAWLTALLVALWRAEAAGGR